MKLKIRQIALLVACLSMPLAFSANAADDPQDAKDSASKDHPNFDVGENFSTILGEDSNAAMFGLSQQGFEKVGGSDSKDNGESIWYNRMSESCVKMTITDGQAQSIVSDEGNEACK